MNLFNRVAALVLMTVAVLLAASSSAYAAAEPLKEIRFGLSTPGTGYPPRISFISVMAVVGEKKFLEQEFEKDGIKVNWVFFKGSGPAANEAMANGQLDFSTVGDLPGVVARAAGVPTKAIFPSGNRTNTYVAVPVGSPITSIAQLKGKRVAIAKGTAGQLAGSRILAAYGLTERDVKIINLDAADAQAAFAAGELDAVFGSITLLRNPDKLHVIYSTVDSDPLATYQQHVVVYESFEKAHPDIVKRVVRALVRASRWSSDEQHRDEIIKLWGDVGGVSADLYRNEIKGIPMAQRVSPLFDDFVRAKDRLTIDDAYRFGLIRKKFDLNTWIDDSYLKAVLKEEGLEKFWPRYDAKGILVEPGEAYAAAVKADPSLAAAATPGKRRK